MENFDIVIVGGASCGAYFAKKMAKLGYSVFVIEKGTKEQLGNKMDIFHIAKPDFEKFNLPKVAPGDAAFAFEFSDNFTNSPYNRYPKRTNTTTTGLHMHEYFLLMASEAENAGAQISYNSIFTDFIFERGKIAGVKYNRQGEERIARAKVVVDASGYKAVCRCNLPKDYGMETFALSPEDMFYVVLRYVHFEDGKDYHHSSTGWPFYKSWVAPCGDPTGAIIGIGACHSYDYAEKIYSRFTKDIQLPTHKIDHIERGVTPYTRTPYTTVADNFIVTGDAACLTKPNCGEGVTSSMVHMDIACDVLDKALKSGNTSASALWQINTRYMKAQGADFESTRAVLTKAVAAKRDEFEYFFKNDIIFSEKFMNNMADSPDLNVSASDILQVVGGILGGLFTRNLSFGTLKNLAVGIILNLKIKKHYLAYPTSPEGLAKWSKKADALWKKTGKMN